MRPIPRKRHLLAVMIFAAVSAAAGYMAMVDDHLSNVQVNIATVAAKRNQTNLLPNDPVFGHDTRWRFHTPAFQTPLEMILVPTGYQDLTLPYRAMTGVLTMIFLCGMYALLYRQCRSWSVSTYVAVLSSTITYTLGRGFWGVGTLASVTPQTMVMAIVPLILLAYLRYENQWQLLLVFAVVGLCGNMHFVTAMNLTMVLLVVFLGRHHFSPTCWPMAIGCLLCAMAAAVPYVGYYYHLRFAAVPAGASISPTEVYLAFEVGRLAVLYPDMLKSLLYWLLWVLVLLIPAVAVLARVERFRVRDLGVWVWFAAGAFFVSLVLHGASQLVGALRNQPPPVIDFAQAANLVMLPLYVLFAQALTNLFRMMRSHKVRLRWLCAAFMALWMIPSDNLRVARNAVYQLVAANLPADRQPLRVQELNAARAKDGELANIADWARGNTDPAAVFLIDSAKFRMLSRRSIAASRDDVKYFYYVTPWDLGRWRKRVIRQQDVLDPPGSKASDRKILKFIKALAAEGMTNVPHWYVILRVGKAPTTPGALKPVANQGWGRYYLLYRAE